MASDFERSKQLLNEAGYDGTPVVLMHSTDLQVLANLAPVAKQLLEIGTHGYVGQWYPIAHRDNVSGLLHGPAPFFWNVSKSE